MKLEITINQQTPSSVWTVEHNLNCKPIVEVIVENQGVLEKIYPETIKHIDDNTVAIIFSTPRSGVVRLVGSPV